MFAKRLFGNDKNKEDWTSQGWTTNVVLREYEKNRGRKLYKGI
ncbi:2626_t:CDS:2 [Paraglomus brasilianum]|uniref:2626_t:CDS:1 n=1 Tax=Paraglomus brasilianum TaxID=144538 RepID=A0A9N8W070_9GLOM|nr:2626_t:CDS:2 [Paraglomus brasilianum]